MAAVIIPDFLSEGLHSAQLQHSAVDRDKIYTVVVRGPQRWEGDGFICTINIVITSDGNNSAINKRFSVTNNQINYCVPQYNAVTVTENKMWCHGNRFHQALSRPYELQS